MTTIAPNTVHVQVAQQVPHGNLPGGSLHSAATTSTAGFMSAADKVKATHLVDLQADLAYPKLIRAQGMSDAAWHAAVAALPDVTPYLQEAELLFGAALADSNDPAMRGGRIYLPEGAYRSATEWACSHPLELYGDLGGRRRSPAKFYPAAGVTPIRLCYGVSNPAGGGTAAESWVHDIAIIQLAQDLAPAWSNGAKTAGDVVRRVNSDATKTVLFVAVNSGTTGVSEPTWNEIEGGTTADGSVTWRTVIVCGMRVQSTCDLARIYIDGVQGHAFELAASAVGTPSGNVNVFGVRRCIAVGALGHGFHAQGSDANAGMVQNCSAEGNQGVGFFDESFIGNAWAWNHASGNALDDHRGATGVWTHCYTEDGGTNTMQRPALVIGGTLGTYVATNQTRCDAPLLRAGGSSLEATPIRIVSQTDPGVPQNIIAALGEKASPTVLYGALDIPGNTGLDAEWRIVMGKDGPGSWVISWVQNAASLQAYRIALFGTGWPTGTMFFPGGIVPGPGDNSGQWQGPRQTSGSAAPTSGTHRQGDFHWNTEPSEIGSNGSKYVIAGWICLGDGTPGTWQALRMLTGN